MNTDAINASAFFAATFITARVPVRSTQLANLISRPSSWQISGKLRSITVRVGMRHLGLQLIFPHEAEQHLLARQAAEGTEQEPDV